jgi:hypothetical protein
MMNWKGLGSKRSWPNFRNYRNICLDVLRKTTRNLSQDSQSSGRYFNPQAPTYKTGVLTTQPRRSVSCVVTPCRFVGRSGHFGTYLQVCALSQNRNILSSYTSVLHACWTTHLLTGLSNKPCIEVQNCLLGCTAV